MVIKSWSTLKNIKQLRAFLGLTGCYRKFVHHCATIGASLTNLLAKNKFEWKNDSQKAFEKLKTIMTSLPIFAFPYFGQPFIVKTNALAIGTGAIVLQNVHPLTYFSKN